MPHDWSKLADDLNSNNHGRDGKYYEGTHRERIDDDGISHRPSARSHSPTHSSRQSSSRSSSSSRPSTSSGEPSPGKLYSNDGSTGSAQHSRAQSEQSGMFSPYMPTSQIVQKPSRSRKTNEDCFIATAVYGNPHAPEVETLREIRDNVLAKNVFGKLFISLYYSGVGESIADFVRADLPEAISPIRSLLDYIVERYRTSSD
jgi:hypothetical protein